MSPKLLSHIFKGLIVLQVVVLGLFLVERLLLRALFPLEWFALKASFQKGLDLAGHNSPPMKAFSYEVRAFDTYWSIAKVMGVGIDSILSYNNPERPHSITVGDVVDIPVVNGIFHEKEHPEETIAMVSADYNVPRQTLEYFNPGFEDLERVFIPGASFSLSERHERLGYLFMRPLKDMRLTSGFGMRIHPMSKRREFHAGIDLGAPKGTLVFASKQGRITYAGSAFGYGKLVVIRHSSRYETKYAHLGTIRVRRGQKVGDQEAIGTIGSTGRSTGYHLHFEVVRDGVAINPLDVTSFK